MDKNESMKRVEFFGIHNLIRCRWTQTKQINHAMNTDEYKMDASNVIGIYCNQIWFNPILE